MSFNRKPRKTISPSISCCDGCTTETGRSVTPNCHGYCERYIEQRKALTDYNNMMSGIRNEERLNGDLRRQGIENMRRRSNKR